MSEKWILHIRNSSGPSNELNVHPCPLVANINSSSNIGKLGQSEVFDLPTIKENLLFLLWSPGKILAILGERLTWVYSEVAAAKG